MIKFFEKSISKLIVLLAILVTFAFYVACNNIWQNYVAQSEYDDFTNEGRINKDLFKGPFINYSDTLHIEYLWKTKLKKSGNEITIGVLFTKNDYFSLMPTTYMKGGTQEDNKAIFDSEK